MSKLSQLIFCFLFALLNLTVTPVLHAENKVPTTTVEDNCNLPAPTGLNVTNITAYTADATWNAVPGAIGYSVVAKNVATQQVYFSTTTTGTAVTITGLPPNTNIEVEVSPICPNGNIGATTEAIITTNIIIDVIASNYNGCDNNNGWSVHLPGTFISFPIGTPYELKLAEIVTPLDLISFVAHGNTQSADKIYFYPTQAPATFILADQTTGKAQIKDGDILVCEITCLKEGQNYKMKTEFGPTGARYRLSYRPLPESCSGNFTPGGPGTGGGGTPPPFGGGRSSDDETMASVETTIIAAPNPFNEQFSLLTNGYLNEPATIQLFNLSGQLVQSITTVLDDQTISVVNTENLPDGMYIAKIQTSQTVNTIKVQKTSPK